MRLKNSNCNFSSQCALAKFIYALVFFLPLFALLNEWGGFFYLGFEPAAYSKIAGVLPFTDGQGYLDSFWHFITTGQLKEISIRRPYFSLWYSFLLRFTENFYVVIVISTFLSIFALFLSSRVLRDKSALFRFVFIVPSVFFISLYAPTLYSESFGFTVGALSFVIIYSAYHDRKIYLFTLGLFFLTLSIISRAGPFLFIPTLLLLLYMRPLQPEKKNVHLAINILSVITAFLISQAISQLFSNGLSGFQANFSYTLYGLVKGGLGWKYALECGEPALSNILSLSEGEQGKLLYEQSWIVFKSAPHLLIIGLSKSTFGCIKWFLSILVVGPYGIVRNFFRVISVSAVLCGFYRVIRNRKILNRDFDLLLAFVVGALLSSAVVWADGQFRVFASVVPFFSLLIAYMFSPSYFSSEAKRDRSCGLIAIVALIIMFFIPISQYFFSLPPREQVSNTRLIKTISLKKQPYIFVSSDETKGHFFVRNKSNFENHLNQQAPEYEIRLKQISSFLKDFVFASIFDFSTLKQMYVIIKDEGSLLNSDSLSLEIMDEVQGIVIARPVM
jgi:hypothetical protein